jgi:hypothetical protein
MKEGVHNVCDNRHGLEANALDDKIYVIGGKTDLGPHIADVNEIFDVDNNNTSN